MRALSDFIRLKATFEILAITSITSIWHSVSEFRVHLCGSNSAISLACPGYGRKKVLVIGKKVLTHLLPVD